MTTKDRPGSFYRNHILLPIFISCTGWNMVRRTLGEAAPILIEKGSLTQSDYALMNTVAFVIYGLSKFVTSHVARGNLFRLYSILFLFVGIVSFLEGYVVSSTSSHYSLLFTLWTLNYALMGTLWPIICIIIKNWLPDEGYGVYFVLRVVRGFSWSIICCCSSIGTILCNSLSQFVNRIPSSIFSSVGMLVIITAVIAYLLFPPYEIPNEYSQINKSSDYKETPKASISEIVSIALLLLSVFISTLNQRVITDWALLMFPEIMQHSDIAKSSSSAISYIEIGGILGTLWCGWISDQFNISRTLLCEITSILAGVLIYVVPVSSSLTNFYSISFLLGFFLYIPFSFSELITIESVDSKYTGFIISMNGLMSPFGSVFSGLPVDYVIRKFGWKSIPSILCCTFILFTILLWINRFIRKQYGDSKDV